MTELFGFLFIVLLGCLGHFIFECSGHRKWAGIFFAVNESTWEHIKLSIYPALLWMPFEIAAHGFSTTLVVAQFTGMAVMMAMIPGLFYGYTAITRKNWLIPDILCFIAAIAAGMWLYSVIIKNVHAGVFPAVLCGTGILLICMMYLRFSYHPPHNFLFRDPQNGGFGPKGHDCNAHFHNM